MAGGAYPIGLAAGGGLATAIDAVQEPRRQLVQGLLGVIEGSEQHDLGFPGQVPARDQASVFLDPRAGGLARPARWEGQLQAIEAEVLGERRGGDREQQSRARGKPQSHQLLLGAFV